MTLAGSETRSRVKTTASAIAAFGSNSRLRALGIVAAEGQAAERSASRPRPPWSGTWRSGRSAAARRTPSPPPSPPAPAGSPPARRRDPRVVVAVAGQRRIDLAARRLQRAARRSRRPCPSPAAAPGRGPSRPAPGSPGVWSFLPRNRLASIARRIAPSSRSSSRRALGLSSRSSSTPTTTTPCCGNSSAEKETFIEVPFV